MTRMLRLDLATVVLPDWHPEAARSRTCDVYGYAIDHPDGVILFDTGVGAGHELIDEMYSPDVVSLGEALAAHGLELDQVVAVVNSHLHFDHCGQNPVFFDTEVPIFVGRDEISAVEQDPIYTVAEWALAPEPQRRLLADDQQIAEGVTVLTAPGHTAGHQALLVESENERIVIAGQAVWRVSEFESEIATDANVTEPGLHAQAVDSIRRIKALRPDRVVFAHCDHWTPSAG